MSALDDQSLWLILQSLANYANKNAVNAMTRNIADDNEPSESISSSVSHQREKLEKAEHFNIEERVVEAALSKVVESASEYSDLDDKFFKLSEMNKLIDVFDSVQEKQDKLESQYLEERRHLSSEAKSKANSDTGSIENELYENDRENEDEQIFYSDFFASSRSGSLAEVVNDSSAKESSKHKESQSKFHETIRSFEEKNMNTKEWYLTGETINQDRPSNGLIENQELDFDAKYISNPPPVVTDTFTFDFENVVRTRILNRDYDNVQRKLPFGERIKNGLNLSTQNLLDNSLGKKSEHGLAKLYQQDYEAQTLGIQSDTEKKLQQRQQEIKVHYDNIMLKLKMLTSFNFVSPRRRNNEESIANSQRLNVASIEQAAQFTPYLTKSYSGGKTPADLYQEYKTRNSGHLENNISKSVGETRTSEELDSRAKKRRRRTNKKIAKKKKKVTETHQNLVKTLTSGSRKKNSNFQPEKEKTALDTKAGELTKSAKFFKIMSETVNADQKHKINLKKNGLL